jgi:hypothetical protein
MCERGFSPIRSVITLATFTPQPFRQSLKTTEHYEHSELTFRINDLRHFRRQNIQEHLVHYIRCHYLTQITTRAILRIQ